MLSIFIFTKPDAVYRIDESFLPASSLVMMYKPQYRRASKQLPKSNLILTDGSHSGGQAGHMTQDLGYKGSQWFETDQKVSVRSSQQIDAEMDQHLLTYAQNVLANTGDTKLLVLPSESASTSSDQTNESIDVIGTKKMDSTSVGSTSNDDGSGRGIFGCIRKYLQTRRKRKQA
jgi:hypothetical protein